MKKYCTVLLIIAWSVPAIAQSRFQTMLNQVAGLESYLASLKKVYSTTTNGLNTIHDLKNGSMSLNQSYFMSLKNPSSAVKNDPHIQAISDLLRQVQQVFGNAISWQQSQGLLTGDELSYMRAVYSNLLAECNKDLQELNMVLSDGGVQMTDKQRIDRIDAIYKDMQGKYSFARSFTHKAYELASERSTSKTDNKSLKTLYNLN
ncbi:MAG: hypothetical protein JST19_03710 [Bacteroidetes bacterium]|nr:hypothetical protein [Bacteroidota bacterium]